MPEFRIKSDYRPSGDQPEAIEKLADSINRGTDIRHFLVLRALVKPLQ